MRKPTYLVAALAALAVPVAGAAAATPPASLVLVADGPVQFSAPTSACPLGIATAMVTVAQSGEQVSSSACAKRGKPCGTRCTRFVLTYDLPLAGGLIRESVAQRQVTSADGRSTGVTLSGTVFRAGGAYAGLKGAPVNGGGAVSVQSDGSFHLNLVTAIG